MTKEQIIHFLEMSNLIKDKVEAIVQYTLYKEGFSFDDVIDLDYYVGRNSIEINFSLAIDSSCYDYKLDIPIDEFVIKNYIIG